MIIYNHDGTIIENPNLEIGVVEIYQRSVLFKYVVSTEEEGHYETVREYPNGGKDIAWVVDVPEEGRWIPFDEAGNEIETELVVPVDAPHELEIKTVEIIGKYRLYSEEELAEIERLKKEEEEANLQPTSEYVSYDEMAAAIREGVNSYNG